MSESGAQPTQPRPDQPRPDHGADDAPAGYGPSALATPANALTVVRLLVSPLLFAMISDTPSGWLVWFVFTALSLTDGVDGWIARRYGTTRSGAFLDPLADKILVLGSMFALVAVDRFPVWPVAVIAVREVAISLYRVYWGRRGLAVPARRSAKAKTLVQSLAVGAVLMPPLTDVTWLADSLLYLAVALAVISAAQYLLDGRRAATARGDRSGLVG
ncbi:MAG: CDP-diacylglycerol--glycerol-3-phosphate 3-phosphatidyltransferase [Acidimicrobiales bacterium]|nr:CDP-diacylglycerol--glycerol-3-phosphate 3-phosphatidyltransferase [Acidimicrobiales bacterium]